MASHAQCMRWVGVCYTSYNCLQRLSDESCNPLQQDMAGWMTKRWSLVCYCQTRRILHVFETVSQFGHWDLCTSDALMTNLPVVSKGVYWMATASSLVNALKDGQRYSLASRCPLSNCVYGRISLCVFAAFSYRCCIVGFTTKYVMYDIPPGMWGTDLQDIKSKRMVVRRTMGHYFVAWNT